MFQLAYDLGKTPAEVRAMPLSDFVGLRAFARFQAKVAASQSK